jgi:hypothetical protein
MSLDTVADSLPRAEPEWVGPPDPAFSSRYGDRLWIEGELETGEIDQCALSRRRACDAHLAGVLGVVVRDDP